MASDDETAASVRVNILFDPKVAESITTELTEAGLEVEQELELLAIITGVASAETVAALSDIDGVLAVEQDRTVHAITESSDTGTAVAADTSTEPSDLEDLFPESPI